MFQATWSEGHSTVATADLWVPPDVTCKKCIRAMKDDEKLTSLLEELAEKSRLIDAPLEGVDHITLYDFIFWLRFYYKHIHLHHINYVF